MKYYGGFWSRFAAIVIDTIVLTVVTGGVAIFLNVPLFTLKPDPAQASKLVLVNIVSIVLCGLYYSIFQGIMQGTLGKKAMGLMLVDAKTLNQISIGQSVGRYLMQFVSAICLFLGYLNVGINKKKQGWHDKVAGTIVIKKSMLKRLREDEGILPARKTIPKSSLSKAA